MSESTEYFCFLDLPAELRLMVYENLPNGTRRINFVNTEDQTSSFTRVITSAPTAILRTSRFVKEEAGPIINATTGRFLQPVGLEGPAPRIEADITSLKHLSAREGVLWLIVACHHALMSSEKGAPVFLFRYKDVCFDSHNTNTGYRIEGKPQHESNAELDKFV